MTPSASFLFLFNFLINSLWVSHNVPQFCLPPSPPYLSLISDISSQKETNFKKQKHPSPRKKQSKTKPQQQKNLFASPTPLLFILVALAPSGCHIAYPFAPSVLWANVHCNESLVWLKASGFWDIILTESSPQLLWNILCRPESWRSCGYPTPKHHLNALASVPSGIFYIEFPWWKQFYDFPGCPDHV